MGIYLVSNFGSLQCDSQREIVELCRCWMGADVLWSDEKGEVRVR